MENISLIVKSGVRGLLDSLRGTIVLFYLDRNIQKKAEESAAQRRDSAKDSPFKQNNDSPSRTPVKPKGESKILKRTCQCCALNGGVFWLSILLFEYVILPSIRWLLSLIFGHAPERGTFVWSWIQPFLSLTFGAFWVVPLFLLSKVVNSLWFQDIADSAYRFSKGRPQYFSGIGKFIADALFSVLVQSLFLMQSMLVSMFPLTAVGNLLSLIHMCLLYSLYAFEYKWYNMGWELHRRLNYIESNWPYFIGFGLPLAFLTNMTTSYIISGCIFSILFPLFIISANEANPVSFIRGLPLKLFSPVVGISNALFNHSISHVPRARVSQPVPKR